MKNPQTKIDVLKKYETLLSTMDPLRPMGRVLQVNGMSILSEGPPDVSVGDVCRVEIAGKTDLLECEVVGFQGHKLILMPFGQTTGVFPDATVLASGRRLAVSVSNDLLGRVLDGLGRPIDGRPPIFSGEFRFSEYEPPGPASRLPIRQPLETGVRAIDSMLTIGCGQRIGIFAGTGVGKSTLLGMIARYTRADINVICLVGERGREVREFIENDLGTDGMKKSVLVVATSDRSPVEKVYAAGFATSIAEYFRDQGKNVNLFMDSLTRYCMAMREIGIASGEQLGPGGYPPAVWHRLSRLVERSGALKTGTITGFYAVLVEGDDLNDPVADNARGMLDGHIVLSRRLGARRHYPAIEITESISRVMDRVITQDHLDASGRIGSLLAAYRENEEILNLGAYAKGSNADVDEAIEKLPSINRLLRQKIEEGSTLAEAVRILEEILKPVEEAYY